MNEATAMLFDIYGLIEATDFSLRIHGVELSKENFATHDWAIINKKGKLKIFHCKRCDIICGLTTEENKYKILATSGASCNELKFHNILK